MASSKDAVVLDIDGHEVRVSNPEKPYFGDRGIRKIDVVEYFVSVGEGILNALRDRPTTLERWPGGVFEGARISTRVDNTGDAFYQKRVPRTPRRGCRRRTSPSRAGGRRTRSRRTPWPWSRGARTSGR